MRTSAYAAITAMTFAWLPAVWIGVFFALWAFGIYRPICCDTSPPQLLPGALYLILPASTLAASLWLSLKAIEFGRTPAALIVSGISWLLGAALSFLLAASLPV